jgi:hypothetical protein
LTGVDDLEDRFDRVTACVQEAIEFDLLVDL